MAGPLSSPARRATRSACSPAHTTTRSATSSPCGPPTTTVGTGRPEAGDLEAQPDVKVGGQRPGHLGEIDDGRVGRVQGGHAGGVRLDLGQLGAASSQRKPGTPLAAARASMARRAGSSLSSRATTTFPHSS